MSDALNEIFCCDALREVAAELPAPAAPTIYRSDDGKMMMVVGLIQTEEGLGYLDQAIAHSRSAGRTCKIQKPPRR
jgi:hypothetical protein